MVVTRTGGAFGEGSAAAMMDGRGPAAKHIWGNVAADSNVLCPQERLEVNSFSCTDVSAAGPITLGTADHGLPENLQGVFWLQDQKDSSALMSFAPSNDGQGLSVWNNDESNIRVRVGGDKVWSFHTEGKAWELVEGIDLVYDFRFNNATNPTESNIIPQAMNWNGFSLDGAKEFVLDFNMNFIPPENHEDRFPDAVTWARPTFILGQNIESSYYEIVQVLKGNGDTTSAFDEWVKYCESPETGNSTGTIFYHAIDNE
eukprot:CAMPEP_0194277324 /NCGR_PEP_ID=MMETSP0169-20130528/9681_1 /TAXON_ID=218684 /ORGANISM="Corethron pennatum, Strain L29A3" /LENGTH=257 /DNA_ID=CAMNT_0039021269 /DNA_START=200 /DNA_END=972 /DNA_ORIENTATION=+